MKILIIAPSKLPIPAICGGAIETLMTYILQENEKHEMLDIDVVTPFHEKLYIEKDKYKNCNFIVYKESKKKLDVLLDFIRKVIYKISFHYFAYYDGMMIFLKKYLKENGCKYEKIIFEGNPMAVLASPNTKEKNILHIHTDIFNLEFEFASKVASYIGEFWAVSTYIKEKIECVGLNGTPVKVMRNCADINIFDPNRSYIEAIRVRDDYGIEETDFVVLFAGRVDETKGVKELVQACIELEIENIKTIIVGGANYSDDSETAYIKEVKELSKAKEGKFIFTGYIEHEKMPSFYSVADVAVVPSKCNEAAPLSLIEARASGCPVIATAKGGIPEYIGEGGILLNGWELVEALKNAIYQLYSDKDYRKRLRQTNMKERTSFSMEKYYNNFVRELKHKAEE